MKIRVVCVVAMGLVTGLLCGASVASAQQWTSGRPDGHAPIGVMGDHRHEAGEWMLSFRFMRMTMDGNRDGTTKRSTDDVLGAFPVAPLRMSMNMSMAGVMFAPSDRVTLTAMLPVLSTSMDHRTRMGVGFTTDASGIGDLKLGGLIGLGTSGRQTWHANVAVGIPTGSIDKRGDTPVASNVRLPYPMQTGSGTWDVLPGVTWLGQGDRWSWGAQGGGTLRFGTNDNGYRLGNQATATAWLAKIVADHASLSLRTALDHWGNVHGADGALNPHMVPTANPALRAGTRASVGVGLNLSGSGALAGHRLAIEFVLPVYQRLDGPQLETDWTLTAGWQKSFGG